MPALSLQGCIHSGFPSRFPPCPKLDDAALVMRGQGRNDYPVRAMWNALLAGVVFQHPSISALIRELDRNPALLQACGFNVLPVQGKPRVQRAPKEGDPGKPVTAHEAPAAPRRAVPTDWSFSRWLFP